MTETPAKPRRRLRRPLLITAAVVVLLVGVLVAIGGSYYRGVPLPQEVRVPERTTIYYRDGATVLAHLDEPAAHGGRRVQAPARVQP